MAFLALAPGRTSVLPSLYPSHVPMRIPRSQRGRISFITPRCGMDLKVKLEKSTYKRELEAAIDVVERACRLCLAVQTGMKSEKDGSISGSKLEKSDASPVTVADFGVQALVSLELGLRFPAIPLVGEEDSSQLREDICNHQGKMDDIQDQPLVETVAQAVAGVASTKVNMVTPDDILNALDRGVKSVPEAETSRIAYWILDPIDGTRGFLKGGDALLDWPWLSAVRLFWE